MRTIAARGLVIDARGQPAFAADVALRGDTIIAIGELAKVTADRVIEVTGLVVAPGFIDVHTHDDLICITRPDMTPKISQGVTTLIVGNCGISAPPLRFSDSVSEPFNLLGQKEDFAYDTFASYRRAIEAVSPRVNVAALVGHSTLRVHCVRDLGRPATASEREQMNVLLQEALDEGALGLSSGVFYAPAQAADVEELQALAQTVGKVRGVYTAHIRDERDGIVEALQDSFAVTRPGRTPLVLSHHKCAGVRNWGRAGETLGLIDAAGQTRPVHLDCYPYTAGSTVIRPDLADGEVEILLNWSTPYPGMAGRTLKSIAAEWGMTEVSAAERLMPGGASYFQNARAGYTGDLATPLLHGRVRRAASRFSTASAPVGHLSSRVGPLCSRPERHQPRNGGPQDDGAVRCDFRPARPRPDRSWHEGGYHGFRSRNHY